MKNFKFLLSILIITVACLFLDSVFSGSENSGFTVQSYIGNVKIKSISGTKQPEVGGIIKKGSTIITGNSSVIDILYNDNTLIRIKDNSSLKIDSIVSKMDKDTYLNLSKGKLYITVSKLKKSSSFKVKTKTMIASVRGTSFSIYADEKTSGAEVLDGKIMVSPVDDGKVISDIEDVVEKDQHIELQRSKIREIIKNRRMRILQIRANRLKRIRNEYGKIPPETIDQLNLTLRREIRLKIIRMKMKQFKKEERDRPKRIKRWLKRRNKIRQLRKKRLEKILKKGDKDGDIRNKLRKRREKFRSLREKRNRGGR